MFPACEIVIHKVLPVIRANLARELINTYGLTQSEVADKLLLSQPAVSQYLSELRGKPGFEIRDRELKRLVSDFALKIKERDLSPAEKTRCFCDICRYTRESGLICLFHPNTGTGSCNVCRGELYCD